MGERYFLGLLVVLSAAGALWVSIAPEIVQSQIWVALLLSLLGLISIANLNNQRQASILLPLYFIAVLAFSLYVYLTHSVGTVLVSSAILALVGAAVSFGVPAMAGPPKVSVVETSASAAKISKPAKKPSKKGRRKKRK